MMTRLASGLQKSLNLMRWQLGHGQHSKTLFARQPSLLASEVCGGLGDLSRRLMPYNRGT